MKWTLNEPAKGDIVRINMGSFYHYGIYVSDDEIIQFGLPPTSLLKQDSSKVEVCSSTLDEFLCGKFIEVGEPDKKEKKKMLKPGEIVSQARSRIGEKGYHILYNNCEHFVNQCAFNEKTCSQIDEVRSIWKNFPFVNVYVEKFPFTTQDKKIYPKSRQQEIDNCGSLDVKNEKFFDWKLLERGIRHSLGLDIKNIDFHKNNGKWECDNFEFSLSHSGNLVAVTVAKKPIGIDIEEINPERFNAIPTERILTENEINTLNDINLNLIWTKKEAVFKKGGHKSFFANKVDTLNEKTLTKIIVYDDKEYYLTIATEDTSFAKFHLGDGLTIKKD